MGQTKFLNCGRAACRGGRDQCGRHPVARGIADQQHDLVAVRHDPPPVTTAVGGRGVEGRNVQATEDLMHWGKEGVLHQLGDLHLLFHADFVFFLLEQVNDTAGHVVKRVGEHADLVVGLDGDLGFKITTGDHLGTTKQRLDRVGQRPREDHANHHRYGDKKHAKVDRLDRQLTGRFEGLAGLDLRQD